MDENKLEQDLIHRLIADLPEYPVSKALHQSILNKVARRQSPLRLVVNKVSHVLSQPYFSAPIAASLLFVLTWFGLQNNQVANHQSQTLQAKNHLQFNVRPQTQDLNFGTAQDDFHKAWIQPVSLGNFENNLSEKSSDLDDANQNEVDPVLSDALASFKFKRALHLRAQGDYQACADLLSQILKVHPEYSQNADVLTIRIDSLFRLGKDYEALKEFSYLKSFDPTHAEILEQRWLKER